MDRDKHDEGFLTISTAAVLAAPRGFPAWAGPAGMERTAPEGHAGNTQTKANPEPIAKLWEASEEAAPESRNGNKDNPMFSQKKPLN